jgi:CheY-like chemotaxis protein
LRGKHVLLIHDNAAQHDMFDRWAAVWGLKLLEAASIGEAGILLESSRPYDLLILDYELLLEADPDVAKTTARLHALPGATNSSILFLSDKSRRAADWEALGARGCVSKPLRSDALKEHIERALTNGPWEQQPPASPFDASAAERFPFRMLVADDSAINRLVAGAMLKRLGYAADTAHNGLEVLQALETGTYGIIFLDVMMPEMDGYETARRIHEKWSAKMNERPRLIALTGYAMAGDRQKCLDAGMDDYLTKPLRVEDLKAALERAASPASAVNPEK